MNSVQNTIRRAPNICYDDFRSAHLLPNKPLLIGPDLIADWPCVQTWRAAPAEPRGPRLTTLFESNGEQSERDCAKRISVPNLEYLKERYGDAIVPVEEDGCRSERPFREVIDIWEGKAKPEGDTKLYVKDWHLALELETSAKIHADRKQTDEEDWRFYTTPGIFADDWMNGWYRRNTKDDFRFVYMGPAGTSTLLHRDVYTSYSWSTNVVGRKRWWLFPPEVTPHITKPNGETISDNTPVDASFDMGKVDETIWPNLGIAKRAVYVVDQEQGETIFVPSGWYHQVLNLTFCISINHNWSNSHNLVSMYHSMVGAVERVENSIEDVKELLQKRLPAEDWEVEWRKVVQDLLKQDAGWDWAAFLGMLLLGVEDSVRSSRGAEVESPTGLDMCNEPSRSRQKDPSFPGIIPDRPYVLAQVTPCIAHFTMSSWGQSGDYDGVLSRIRNLISQ